VHGSHLYVVIAASIAALILFDNRLQVLKIAVPGILLAGILTTGINTLMQHDKQNELSWSLVGSKVLVQIPGAIDAKCDADPDFLMCDHKDNIRAGMADWCYTDPDCFVWRNESFFKRADRAELNAASREMFLFAVMNMPAAVLRATAADLLTFYSSECSKLSRLSLPKAGGEPSLAGAPMHEHGFATENPAYHRSLQAAGIWQTSQMCKTRRAAKLIAHLMAVAGLALLLILRAWPAAAVAVFCLFVVFANDFLFAALSGGYLRYHDRNLFLAIIPLLLAMDQLRSRRGGFGARGED
ncbi:MAG: hypothetical protein OEQ13_14660, partial [Acidobacteriota bacterium]|nr:hypothetical protein [Acidobacteriota bacterium]